MQIDRVERDDTLVLKLQGRLVAGVGDEALRDAMTQAVGEGWQQIVLDLSEVSRVDSSGVGEVVSSTKLARRFGGRVKLVRLGDQVHRVLKLSQLLPVLDIYDSEDEAVRAFADA